MVLRRKRPAAASALTLAALAGLAVLGHAWVLPPAAPRSCQPQPPTQRARRAWAPTVVGMTAPNAEEDSSSPPPPSSSSSAPESSSSPVAQSFSPFKGGAPSQQPQTRRPGIVFTEEINFCLPREEGSGEGSSEGGDAALLAGMNPAVLRTVNSFANQAAKKILIAVDCCFQDMSEAVKARLRSEYGTGGDVEAACGFIDAVSALSPCCELNVQETKSALSPAYHEPYSRVLDTLLSNNCEFRSLGLKEPKVRPRDRDICLSLYDTITGAPTRTKLLNSLSNRVARTMLYGDEEDVGKLTREMQTGRQPFLEEWVGGEEKADEAYYYDSLLASLQAGLDAPPPPAAMGGGYSNAYQRFMAFLVQELGSRPASVDGELFDSFVRWESSLRKNLTQDMWDPHPKELTGQWTLYDDGGSGLTPAGESSSSATAASGGARVSVIGFRKDGTLKLPPGLGVDGMWRFEPGPTHLDTIRFEIRLGTPDNRVLAYTGYVDRGQRIETRFSRRAIKMKGRMMLRVRGETRASSKFIMELERKRGKLLGIGGGQQRESAGSMRE